MMTDSHLPHSFTACQHKVYHAHVHFENCYHIQMVADSALSTPSAQCSTLICAVGGHEHHCQWSLVSYQSMCCLGAICAPAFDGLCTQLALAGTLMVAVRAAERGGGLALGAIRNSSP